MKAFDVVIVGTGHGGAQCAIALRQQGFAGTIAMVGRESVPPYERPPLSKDYLAGTKAFDRIQIRPADFWLESGVELLLGSEVVVVDGTSRHVVLSDGSAIGFGTLVWSAGGIPRKLNCKGSGLDGVHSVRDKADVDRIVADLKVGPRKVVVVGGGYIGLEAAAVLTKLGHAVTLIEGLDRVLARVAGETLSRFFEAEHRAHGVDLRLGGGVASLEASQGRVSGVRLGDGSLLRCDLVIVGIGIQPSVGPLKSAGASISDGVDVDEFCRTTIPAVFAIGDCAAHRNKFAGDKRIRLESVQNATDMAAIAAKAICGKAEPYRATPWFWSNQYNLRLQTVGLSAGHDAAVVRGNPASRSFSLIYSKNDRVVAIDCVNATRDFVQGRKLIEAETKFDPAVLSDEGIALKDLLGTGAGI